VTFYILVGHVCRKNSRAGVGVGRRNTWRPVYHYRRSADTG